MFIFPVKFYLFTIYWDTKKVNLTSLWIYLVLKVRTCSLLMGYLRAYIVEFIQYTQPFIKNGADKAISIMHKGVTMRLRYDVGSLRALVVTWKVVFSVG